jgi:integral membrane protein
MAKVTGVTLLIFTLEILLKYAVGSFTDVSVVLRWVWWIPFVHGWVFVVYLVTALNLWLKLRWPLKRLIAMALAGALPGASFVMEARISRRAQRAFDLVEYQLSRTSLTTPDH